FGNGAYGIGAAADIYFAKEAGELSIAEGALLAGIIKSPSNYAPHINPENALKRRDSILKSMLDTGAITQNEYDTALSEKLALSEKENTASGSWYTDAVMAEAAEILGTSIDEIMSGGLHIYTAYDPAFQLNTDELFSNGANFPDPAADGTPVQAALIAMEPVSGEICAMAGGREYEVRRGLNRALDIRRQPGSAIKPISSYAAAIDDHDFLPVSMIRDIKREFPGKYLPGNAGGSYYGIVTLREALSRSLNVATVDLADLIGIQSIRRKLADFGIEPAAQDVNLSLSLGSMTYGVSPAELCAAYASLSNGGMQVKPHTIRRITDSLGKPVYQFEPLNKRAVKKTTAFLITDMLKTAASSGSAKALSSSGIPVAGKTGTVGESGGGNRDIWTVACTPDISVAVWMGFDRPDSEHALSDNDGGSSYPARLCAAFLSSGRDMLSKRDFPIPGGLVSAEIDRIALIENDEVMLASENTPAEYVQTEWFRQSQLPQTVSTLWNEPEAVTDLSLISEEGEPPALAFTCRSAAADYLVIRKDGGTSDIAAVLNAEPGNAIVWCDADADPSQPHAYSILPRHRLMYECGTLLTGPESETLYYSPGNLFSRLFGT
ncbi:MAG: transglycosylase domain-containing protein, partial [Clostridia bacterium]|nr:transglycosylase domain-containing protein [Clostridia bacterium]